MATKTEHLGLHQWEPEDSFLRTDFNEDFAKIDAGVGQEAAARQAAVAAEAQARASGDETLRAAVGALQHLVSASCVAGSVTITDYRQSINVNVGFRPKFALVMMAADAYHIIWLYMEGAYYYLFAKSGLAPNVCVTPECLLTDTGFQLPNSFLSAKDNNKTKAHYVAFA